MQTKRQFIYDYHLLRFLKGDGIFIVFNNSLYLTAGHPNDFQEKYSDFWHGTIYRYFLVCCKTLIFFQKKQTGGGGPFPPGSLEFILLHSMNSCHLEICYKIHFVIRKTGWGKVEAEMSTPTPLILLPVYHSHKKCVFEN